MTSITRRDSLRFLGLAGAAAMLSGGFARAADATPAGAPAATGQPVSTVPSPNIDGEQAGYFRFKIGSFDAVALDDGGFGGPLEKSPWPTADQSKLAEDLKNAFLPTSSFNVPFNILLVRMGSDLVLIDAGCGQLLGPSNGRLLRRLAAIGVQPSQINAVFLSHAHGDHFGGLLDIHGQAVFANAQHYVSRREYEFWTGSTPDLSSLAIAPDDRRGAIANARHTLEALKSRWHFISAGAKVRDGIEIIDASGHTPGHLAFLFGSGNDQLLHFVDTAHHHAISFANPGIAFAFDTEPKVASATRRQLLDRAAADRTRVFGAHMPFPGLGFVRRVGDHYEHVIEPCPAV